MAYSQTQKKTQIVKPTPEIKWFNSNDSVVRRNKFYDRNIAATHGGVYKKTSEPKFILLQKNEYVIRQSTLKNDSLQLLMTVRLADTKFIYKVTKFTSALVDKKNPPSYSQNTPGDIIPTEIFNKIRTASHGSTLIIMIEEVDINGVVRPAPGRMEYTIMATK